MYIYPSTLACGYANKKFSCWMYHPLMIDSVGLILLLFRLPHVRMFPGIWHHALVGHHAHIILPYNCISRLFLSLFFLMANNESRTLVLGVTFSICIVFQCLHFWLVRTSLIKLWWILLYRFASWLDACTCCLLLLMPLQWDLLVLHRVICSSKLFCDGLMLFPAPYFLSISSLMFCSDFYFCL